MVDLGDVLDDLGHAPLFALGSDIRDFIGQLGNSGSSSSGPHLHFHIADARSELAAEGLPYVFRNFEVVGAYDGIETFTTGERWKPPSPAAAGRRSMELPGANTVILFPGD